MEGRNVLLRLSPTQPQSTAINIICVYDHKESLIKKENP